VRRDLSPSDAANAIQTDEPVEVRNLRRIGDIRKWCTAWTDREVMDENAERRDTAGDRRWRGIRVWVSTLRVSGHEPATGDESGGRSDKLPTREGPLV
jgi:hypothetical protein